MSALTRKPALPAAATPATAASPNPETKYRSTSWQIMIVTMPTMIGGAMARMCFAMEPFVRSFMPVPFHGSAAVPHSAAATCPSSTTWRSNRPR
ncbi:hypothetical protein ACVWXO_005123 [Bradyrhizobium sp. LM2.7]